MSTYAMPSMFGHTFTLSEWAELNRLRLAARAKERNARALKLRQSRYAALGTDHPALLVRELAHDMSATRCRTSESATVWAERCKRRGEVAEFNDAVQRAEQDLAEARAWAALYCTLMVAAKRVLTRVGAHLEHLVHRIAERVQTVRPDTEHRPALPTVALACHLAPQAPPAMATHRTHCGGARPSTTHLQKGGENN